MNIPPPVTVVVDARWIYPQLSGIGTYTLELLSAFGKKTPSHFRFHIWIQNEERRKFISHETNLATHPQFSFFDISYGIFDPRGQWKAKQFLSQHHVDIYHSPNFMIPLLAFPREHTQRKTKCVCSIHDLIPLLHPEFTPRALKTRFFVLYKALMHDIARRTDHVLTVSETSKRDIVRELKLSPEQITAVWNGVGSQFVPGEEKSSKSTGIKTILFVGRSDPYKNLTGLIRAFASMLQKRKVRARLQIIGSPDPRYPEAMELARQLQIESHVEWSGYMDNAALLHAYQDADVLALLSHYEGFGLPVAEAMACGTPVVCSNVGSLPEVAGEAAMLVNPNSVEECSTMLYTMLTQPETAETYRQAGLARSKQFSWEKHADRVLQFYEELATASTPKR